MTILCLQYLIVSQDYAEVHDEDRQSIPAWIQIHGLPPDCWTLRILNLIKSEVGRPLYMNKLTRTRERLTYVRILVEVGMEGKRTEASPITLPTSSQLDLAIIYEGMSKYYTSCHRIGYHRDKCRGSNEAAQDAQGAKQR